MQPQLPAIKCFLIVISEPLVILVIGKFFLGGRVPGFVAPGVGFGVSWSRAEGSGPKGSRQGSEHRFRA